MSSSMNNASDMVPMNEKMVGFDSICDEHDNADKGWISNECRVRHDTDKINTNDVVRFRYTGEMYPLSSLCADFFVQCQHYECGDAREWMATCIPIRYNLYRKFDNSKYQKFHTPKPSQTATCFLLACAFLPPQRQSVPRPRPL